MPTVIMLGQKADADRQYKIDYIMCYILNSTNYILSTLSISSKWLLTFVEAGFGPLLQQQFGQVIISHTDGTHQWSPFKVQPHLHIQTCPQTVRSVNKLHPYLITYIANMGPTVYIYTYIQYTSKQNKNLVSTSDVVL